MHFVDDESRAADGNRLFDVYRRYDRKPYAHASAGGRRWCEPLTRLPRRPCLVAMDFRRAHSFFLPAGVSHSDHD
jgi:hypothetical protein